MQKIVIPSKSFKDLKDKCQHWENLINEEIESFKAQFSCPDAHIEVLGFNGRAIAWFEKVNGQTQLKSTSYEVFGQWVAQAIQERMVRHIVEQRKQVIEMDKDHPGFQQLLNESKDLPLVDEDYGQFSGVVRMTYANDTHIFDHLYFGDGAEPDCIRKHPKPTSKT